MVRHSMAGNEYVSPLYSRLFWGAFVLFVGVAFLMQVMAEPLIRTVFVGYEQSVLPLKILIWGLPISLLRLRYSFELISAEQDVHALIATLCSLILSLPIFLLLTTRMGIIGTSYATLIAIFFQALFLGIKRWRMRQDDTFRALEGE